MLINFDPPINNKINKKKEAIQNKIKILSKRMNKDVNKLRSLQLDLYRIDCPLKKGDLLINTETSQRVEFIRYVNKWGIDNSPCSQFLKVKAIYRGQKYILEIKNNFKHWKYYQNP